MEKLFISLEKEVFKGNVLDFTYKSESIIYNSNKFYDNYIELDYVDAEIKDDAEHNNLYDSCILFFILNKLTCSRSRKNLFNMIDKVLKDNGYIYIWDIEKKPLRKVNQSIVVGLPDKTVSKFQIKSFNFISKCDSNSIIEELKDHFVIEEKVQSRGAFKLVCRRKDVKTNEGNFSWCKF